MRFPCSFLLILFRFGVQHWTKGKSATLDQAFATWKQERSEFDDEQSISIRDQSPSPSDDEDRIPDEP